MNHRFFTLFNCFFVSLLFFFGAGCQEKKQFTRLKASESGVDFANIITERDTQNILDMEFVYNGGGIGIGDLNGDGRDDLYFTGNQVENRLYLNEGNLRFKDVTKEAGVLKKNQYQWSSGVNIVDLNVDGKADIYVSNSVSPDSEQRRNLLFINQGNDASGIPKFVEMGRAYGLDDPSHSAHTQFFDCDNDGDLDAFIGVNFIDHQYPNQFVNRLSDGTAPTRDILLRNDWNEALGHPVFTDISLQAGIVWAGYSHSSLVWDFNEDGWQDIYVANDYLSNDLLYINNKNGTFTNRIADIFKHQAMSAMGSDLGDVDNDGRPDVVVTEMQPWYNKRKKLFQGGSSYQMYLFNEQYKYEYQYTRNVLQRNAGIDPSNGLPRFSDIGLMAGVQETDWSWSPLLADFDNDGFRDLYVTNGFPRDVTDHDFAEFRKTITSTLTSKQELHDMIPQVKSSNFMFRNRGDMTFEDVSAKWGLDVPSFTNGAAYADLDNDGDLDIITNNIDDPAFVWRNNTNPLENKDATKGHFLRVQLAGSAKNPQAFGTKVTVWAGGAMQTAYIISGRAYLSKSENTAHFGLGAATVADSVQVKWPDGKLSVLRNVSTNTTLAVSHQQAVNGIVPLAKETPLFKNATTEIALRYTDEENDFIDFNYQRTLPHKFSQYGPAFCVGDANGDGLEDVFFAGSGRYPETWLWQLPGGGFRAEKVQYKTSENIKEEDAGVLLFDADGDGDQDLYIVRGSGQFPAGDSLYQDVLCVNDGKGRFKISAGALPEMRANGSCVKSADFDGDGDLDLFVGSRVLPRAYPFPDRCYLLRNDSQGKDQPKFTDVTESICPDLRYPGLISDALWSDFNGDKTPDLILAGEWMPLTFFANQNGRFTNVTAQTGLADYQGWWSSLAAVDFDNDGDMDFVAGNAGKNLYFQCSAAEPLRVYGKDFDKNGAIDPFISCYWRDSTGQKHEYFYHPREDVIKQMVGIRKKFNTYGAYGEATVQDIFSPAELEGALIMKANWMQTSVVQNLGGGKFALHALPNEAQIAPIFGILPCDVNGDKRPDLLLSGNDYGMELQQGRADAFNGLVLIQQPDGQFQPINMEKSHFIVPREGRGLALLKIGKNREVIIAAQNRAQALVFELYNKQ
jgi:enediyne biosynthesis protein E4